MRTYDVLLIADARLTDEEIAQLGGRLQESLVALGGEVVSLEDWGRRPEGSRPWPPAKRLSIAAGFEPAQAAKARRPPGRPGGRREVPRLDRA